MGCFFSKEASKRKYPMREDPSVLASETAFSVSEFEALVEPFKSISSSVVDDGLISKEEFNLAIFDNKKKDNLFAGRIFDMFYVKKKGAIDFGDFVRSLSVFHPKASLQDKIDFSFRLYDLYNTGFIERQVVKQMLIAFLSESETKLAEDALEKILDKDATANDISSETFDVQGYPTLYFRSSSGQNGGWRIFYLGLEIVFWNNVHNIMPSPLCKMEDGENGSHILRPFMCL